MYNSFLIKYGEIGIKGDNRHLFEDALAKRRHLFEDALAKRIRTLLARIDGEFDVTKTRGRIYVNCGGNWNFDETIDVLQHVFGIVGICPVVIYEKGDIEKLRADIVSYISEEHPGCTSTFKVKARRVDKEYPLTSMEVDAELGEAILMAYPSMKVDVHDPEILFDVEIRDEIYIYSKIIPGPGGMPIGTVRRDRFSGRGLDDREARCHAGRDIFPRAALYLGACEAEGRGSREADRCLRRPDPSAYRKFHGYSAGDL